MLEYSFLLVTLTNTLKIIIFVIYLHIILLTEQLLDMKKRIQNITAVRITVILILLVIIFILKSL